MKQLLTFLALIFSYMLCGAQATTLVVDNKVAGTLSQRILYDDQFSVRNLTIIGEINSADFDFIRKLNKEENLQGCLDLSKAQIAGNVFNIGAFRGHDHYSKIIIPESIEKWDNGSFLYNSGGYWHTAYPTLDTDSLIINCPALKTIGSGIGGPIYLYIGEGCETMTLDTKTDDYTEGRIKFKEKLELHLPSTIKNLNGHKNMGTPEITVYSHILDPTCISVYTANFVDTFFSNGIVYAPADTKDLYEISIFKNLEIISPVSVKGITLNRNYLTLNADDKFELSIQFNPNNADNKSVNWTSTNKDIVTVNESGTITAIRGGVARIVVTSLENPEITTVH